MITLTAHDKSVVVDIPPEDHIAKIIDETQDWYERGMLDDIYRRHPDGIALDVGACFGTHAIWFNKVCGMPVIAFEPNPAAQELLENNIKVNHLEDGIRLIKAAVGNRGGAVQPLPPTVQNNLGSTPMKLLSRGLEGTPMITIDSLDLKNVALIKVDTEGFELKVLQGAEQTLRKYGPLVYVEAAPRHSLPRIQKFLGSIGYTQFGVFNKTPTYGFERRSNIVEIRPPDRPLKLSATIMAHPSRERFIPYLHQKMGVVPVTWDEKQNRWDTGRRSMLAFDPTATHHIVVQDDALLCNDFMETVRRAIATVPNNPISFYSGHVRPNAKFIAYMVERAQDAKCTWIQTEGPWWGVAVVVPTELIPDMIAWCDKQVKIDNYDTRMSRYFLFHNIDCYYSVPSLVSHRIGEGNPSLVQGRGNGDGRVSYEFIGEDVSGLTINWTHTAVRPGLDAPEKRTP